MNLIDEMALAKATRATREVTSTQSNEPSMSKQRLRII